MRGEEIEREKREREGEWEEARKSEGERGERKRDIGVERRIQTNRQMYV